MEKKLLASVFIALLAGLGGGYGLGYAVYQPQISVLQSNVSHLQSEVSMLKTSENKTWHFVVNFTDKASSPFHIQGEKWRIKWNLLTVERVVIKRDPLNGWQNRTRFQIEYRGWTGFMVYDSNEYLIANLEIALGHLVVHYGRHATFSDGYGTGVGWYDSAPQNIKGIFQIFQGEGDFCIETEGIVTPVALTIESYH